MERWSIWKLNFSEELLPQDSRKNFDSLLVSLGVKEQNDPAYQWADYALVQLLLCQQGFEPQCLKDVLAFAQTLGLIKPKAVDSAKPSSTPSAPATSGSPAST